MGESAAIRAQRRKNQAAISAADDVTNLAVDVGGGLLTARAEKKANSASQKGAKARNRKAAAAESKRQQAEQTLTATQQRLHDASRTSFSAPVWLLGLSIVAGVVYYWKVK